VRAYEFATFFADVIAGNFQLYTLQWTGGALADPDILRRVFHSTQEPPSGFNRGRYANPQVDRLLDAASTAIDRRERLELLAKVQRVIATDVPYISLWRKTNFAIARSGLEGIRLSPMADFFFLRDVARARTLGAN
jgi:peptide/nickel transport system substrate-binding protein